jgi:hypothetical protein
MAATRVRGEATRDISGFDAGSEGTLRGISTMSEMTAKTEELLKFVRKD